MKIHSHLLNLFFFFFLRFLVFHRAMAGFSRISMVLCVWVAVVFGLCSVSAIAELQAFPHPTKGDGSLSFLVVGDWGRRGDYNQSQVALQVIESLKLTMMFCFSCCHG